MDHCLPQSTNPRPIIRIESPLQTTSSGSTTNKKETPTREILTVTGLDGTIYSEPNNLPNNTTLIIEFSNGQKYEGPLENGIMHGTGKMTWKSGKVYEGDFVNGEMDSEEGKVYVEKKYHYVGQVKNGDPCGVGQYTFSDGTCYVGPISQNKFNGTGKIIWTNCNTYFGDFLDGQRTGFGEEIIKATGEVYVGQFNKGKREGQGTLTYPNGDTYVGGFSNGKYAGQGQEFTKETGTTYEGGFRNGVRHGSGTISLPGVFVDEVNHRDGLREIKLHDSTNCQFTGRAIIYFVNEKGPMSEYVGDVVLGKMHGKGTLIDLLLGDVYEGGFDNNRFHGLGEITFKSGKHSGDKYQGCFYEGQKHGQGIYTYAVGDVFEGNWKNGVWNGAGKYTSITGAISAGNWEDGLLSGAGKYYFKDGDWIDGEYKKGILVSGTRYFTNGNVYTGEFVDDGVPHGKGKLTYGNGPYHKDTYEGDFVDGARTGKGKYTWPNGNWCDGDIVNGVFHGEGMIMFVNVGSYVGKFEHGKQTYGTFSFNDGRVYEGYFNDGQPNGFGKMWDTNGVQSVGIF
jgi:hypothetical protein